MVLNCLFNKLYRESWIIIGIEAIEWWSLSQEWLKLYFKSGTSSSNYIIYISLSLGVFQLYYTIKNLIIKQNLIVSIVYILCLSYNFFRFTRNPVSVVRYKLTRFVCYLPIYFFYSFHLAISLVMFSNFRIALYKQIKNVDSEHWMKNNSIQQFIICSWTD